MKMNGHGKKQAVIWRNCLVRSAGFVSAMVCANARTTGKGGRKRGRRQRHYLTRIYPFEAEFKAELRKHHQTGRMDMLFNLVDAGYVPLDVAASFAKINVEEAADMLQGWIEAQQI